MAARRVTAPVAAAEAVEESITTTLEFKAEKVHSRVYHGDDMGSLYIPRELLERIGTPDALEITIRPKR